jgi:hypothetical protein
VQESNSVLPDTTGKVIFYGGGVVFYRFVAGDAGYVGDNPAGFSTAAIEDQDFWYTH